MKFTLLISFRPTHGYHSTPFGNMTQDENFEWYEREIDKENKTPFRRWEPIDGVKFDTMCIDRAIKSLRKNSIYKHKVIIMIDADLFPNKKWMESLGDNIEFYTIKNQTSETHMKSSFGFYELINSLPDNELVGYAFSSDIVFGKNWDKYIVNAIDSQGLSYIYSTMLIEPSSAVAGLTPMTGEKVRKDVERMGPLTGENIWVHWRANITWNGLSIPLLIDRDYWLESDLDNWSKISNEYPKNNIQREAPGLRQNTMFSHLIAQNSIFKKASQHLIENARGGLGFDDNLPTDKMGVRESHIFHLHNPCVLDNIEVEHKD